MLGGLSKLVNEVTYVSLIEVHEFMDVGQIERGTRSGGLGCYQRAAVDVLEGLFPVGEESPIQMLDIIIYIGDCTYASLDPFVKVRFCVAPERNE